MEIQKVYNILNNSSVKQDIQWHVIDCSENKKIASLYIIRDAIQTQLHILSVHKKKKELKSQFKHFKK